MDFRNLDWDEINALSIWSLPAEERPDSRSREYNELCECCTRLLMPDYSSGMTVEEQNMLAKNREKAGRWDNIAFVEAFCSAYRSYVHSEKTPSFKNYLSAAMGHRTNDIRRRTDEEEKYGFSLNRSTASNLRKIDVAYKLLNPHSDGLSELLRDDAQLRKLAKAYGIRAETLRDILLRRRIMVRSSANEDDEENEPTEYDNYADPNAERFAEEQTETGRYFGKLHDFLLSSDLETREKWSRNYAVFTSAHILGDIRLKETGSPRESIPERMNRCDEWRLFERDHCLWDDLLLRDYARYTIREPYEPNMLSCCAVNALKREEFPPHAVKTIADYKKVSSAAVSQKKKTWEAKMRELLKTEENNNG